MSNRESRFDMYLKRIAKTDQRTIGQIWIDGKFICDTLENPVRNLPETCPDTPKYAGCKCKEKVYGKTAIPEGEYWCRVSYSPKFKGNYIEIMDVPHFLGIRIHSGTNVNHTEGCPLVGEYNVGYNGFLKHSFEASAKLKKEITKKLKNNQWSSDGGYFKIIIK